MKKYSFLLIMLAAVVLSSCGARTNSAEDMVVPVAKAVSNSSYGKLKDMLPTEDMMEDNFNVGRGPLGAVYYNKYTTDYQLESLQAKLRVDMDIIEQQSEMFDLNWDKVKMGEPKLVDNFTASPGYTIVTIPLIFGEERWNLIFHAINLDSDWRLYNYIGLRREQAS